MYKVHVGGRRYLYFSSLDAAREFCNEVARKTRIILSIERVS